MKTPDQLPKPAQPTKVIKRGPLTLNEQPKVVTKEGLVRDLRDQIDAALLDAKVASDLIKARSKDEAVVTMVTEVLEILREALKVAEDLKSELDPK